MIPSSSPKISRIVADWKDSDGLVAGFRAALKNYGLHLYSDPTCSGSDTYGFIVSDVKLSQKEIRNACKVV